MRASRKILLALSAVILLMAVTVFLTARWVTSQYAEDKAQEIPSHLLNFPGRADHASIADEEWVADRRGDGQ